MRGLVIFLLFLCVGFSNITRAQSGNEQDALVDEARELIYSSPLQAIKIGEHLLKNTDTNDKRAKAALLIAESYVTQGDYNNALPYVFRAGNFATAAENKVLEIQILICKSELLRRLMLEDQSVKYLEAAQRNSQHLKEEQLAIKARLAQSTALGQLQSGSKKNELLYAISSLQNYRNNVSKKAAVADGDLMASYDLTIGKIYRFMNSDSAIVYYENALKHFNLRDSRLILQKSVTLNEAGKYYFSKKNFSKAGDYFKEALQSAVAIRNIPLQRDINKQWSLTYLALGDKALFDVYNRKFLALNDYATTQETEAINTAFNLISREQELNTEIQGKNYTNMIYAACGCFALLLVVAAILFFRNYSRKKRYTEIVKYLEISKNALALQPPVKK